MPSVCSSSSRCLSLKTACKIISVLGFLGSLVIVIQSLMQLELTEQSIAEGLRADNISYTNNEERGDYVQAKAVDAMMDESTYDDNLNKSILEESLDDLNQAEIAQNSTIHESASSETLEMTENSRNSSIVDSIEHVEESEETDIRDKRSMDYEGPVSEEGFTESPVQSPTGEGSSPSDEDEIYSSSNDTIDITRGDVVTYLEIIRPVAILQMTEGFVDMLSYSCLMYGAISKKKSFLMPYLLFAPVGIVSNAIASSVFAAEIGFTHPLSLMIQVQLSVEIIADILVFIVVFSFKQKLKTGGYTFQIIEMGAK